MRTKLKVVHFGSIAQQVEHLAVNQVVAGSNPVASALRNVVQVGRTLGLGPRSRKFESCHSDFASVAQLVEQLICNQPVVGPSPIGSFCGIDPQKSGFLPPTFVVRHAKKRNFEEMLRNGSGTRPSGYANSVGKFWVIRCANIWRGIEVVITRRP